MNFLCKCIGGSHMYGLEGPDSDIDYRGVFSNDNINTIIGLDRFEHQDLKTETEDAFYFEIRHYLNSMRKSNTQAIELIFNTNWIEVSDVFKDMQFNREQLIDSEHLYNSLSGYLHNEWRLCSGQRKCDIGSKRRNQLDMYGYSPKNYINSIRLCHSGVYFYHTGIFPSNFAYYIPVVAKNLKKLKSNPEKRTLKELEDAFLEAKQMLDEEYSNTKIHFKFNKDYANEILIRVYGPKIIEEYRKIQ